MKSRDAVIGIVELKQLLQNCIKGDDGAIMRFQELFGEDIYNFPVKARHVDSDVAADFYCYCFEGGRIFRRLATFQGRCSLRSYQFMVLNNIYSEWQRSEMKHEVSFESLDAPLNSEDGATMLDFLKDENPLPLNSIDNAESLTSAILKRIYARLSQEDVVYIKLLAYHELGISMDDLRAISAFSSKTINEIVDALYDIDKKLAKKSEEYSLRFEKLDEIDIKILSMQKELGRINKEAAWKNKDPDKEIAELKRKIDWRKRQKQELLAQYKNSETRLSYRDIAAILSVSLGTVSDKARKAKEKFMEFYKEAVYECDKQ